MKHPVSVSELLELHRLGELYLKWAETPFALSEENLQELQEISDRYSINHSSALFSFQKQHQREMVGEIEQTIDSAIDSIPGLAAALAMVPTTSLLREEVRTPAAKWADMRLRRQSGEAIDMDEAWRLAVILGEDLQSFYNTYVSGGVRRLWPGEAVWFERKARELDVPIFHMEVQRIMMNPLERPLSPAENQMLQEAMDRAADPQEIAVRVEPDEALHEQLHEENEVDRESAKDHAADLRQELSDGENPLEREISILRDIANVDELTEEENERLDYLVQQQSAGQQVAWNNHKEPFARSKPVPAGVVQDAITTGHIEKIK